MSLIENPIIVIDSSVASSPVKVISLIIYKYTLILFNEMCPESGCFFSTSLLLRLLDVMKSGTEATIWELQEEARK